MSKEKVNFVNLAEQLSQAASIQRKSAEDFLKLLASTLEDALLKGDVVKIKGLGTFKLQWNEPRKSVDVNTGTEIVIEGYYKVAFAPENALREVINEPFAHLQTVVLTSDPNLVVEKTSSDEETQANFDYFKEQATEIKELLSELKAMDENSKLPESESVNIQNHSSMEEAVTNTATASETPSEEVEVPLVAETILTTTPTTTPVSTIDEPTQAMTKEKPHKAYKNVWLPMVLLGMVIGAALLYVVSTLNLIPGLQLTPISLQKESAVEEVLPTMELPVIDTVKVLNADTLQEVIPEIEPPIDSLQYLLKARTYTEFIATETVMYGSRLTRIAERHYGEKLLWVFIYEANKSLIEHPEQVKTGTVLRIPKLHPRLTDIQNPQLLEYLRGLQSKYLLK